MAKSKWRDIPVGDFFTAKFYNEDGEYPLYQKIGRHSYPYNAILLNTGEVCCVAETELFERVEVAFDINPTE